MGSVALEGFGSGGAALNFKVVPGLTQPGTAEENTIWVKTEKIASWYFSATQPEGIQERDVWFFIGTSSPVEFDALKKNGIQVYPISAKQYISGAWVDKTAKSYQNGKWVPWVRYLYNAGNEYEEITGGWTSDGYTVSGYTTSGAEKKADCISFANGNSGMVAQIIGTANKVNMNDIKNIRVTYKNTLLSNGFALELKIMDGKDGGGTSKLVKQFTAAAGVITTEDIPISSGFGNCYILFMTNKARNAEIYSVEYT